jgi:PadR family transcriptional regulator, regulatory protein PadR
MRRKPGTLLPLEAEILDAGLRLRRGDQPRFHGFQLARHLAGQDGARPLTAHGTLYKALARLEDAGMLESVWEDAEIAVTEGRPRRRLYEVTGAGERALATWPAQQPGPSGAPARPRLDPA